MHRVGKVHGGGATGQFLDVAFGGEHIGFVREQVHLHVLDELHGVAGFLLQLQQPLHPALGAAVGGRAGFVIGLVQPVGGDAVVGHGLHFFGANLHFQGNAGAGLQRGMQGLIAIGLGNGDVVLEAAGNGGEIVMGGAEHAVAGVDPVHDDAEAEHIHDVGEGFVLLLHLGVNAVEVLFAAQYPGFDTFFFQAVFQAGLDGGEDFLAVAAGLFYGLANQFCAHGVDGVKGQVLVFHPHVVHAQPEGDGGVQFQGFGGNAATLFGAHHMQGAHVVQAVSQLDEDDADVPGHGQHHLAQVFRLLLRFRFELDLGDLGNAVHQLGHLLAEFVGQLFFAEPGVLDHIVQHGGHERGMVHVHVGEDVGHCQRVSDVRIPGAAVLAFVCLLGKMVSVYDLGDLIIVQVTA